VKPIIQREFTNVRPAQIEYVRAKDLYVWSLVNEKDRLAVRRLAQQYRSAVPYLNEDLLLKWIRACNPHVYDLLNSTPEWKAWFTEQCKYVQRDLGVP
jgi:hypothetical protein